jgi:tRNA-specific 2-thiouridylase
MLMIGLSGGVDSAVAAALLRDRGQCVEALFMKNWEEDDTPGYCAAAADLADAQAVADQLGIPLHTVNFAAEYWDRVFMQVLDDYRHLRTPNPDVLCNVEIKFDVCLDYACSLGATALATGHYARIVTTETDYQLHRCADANKDQTYFLHRLTQAQLQQACFPLADYTKEQVRAFAQQFGLKNATKKDSTGLCFIGERPFRDFLSRWLPPQPGPIETDTGQVIGSHQGLAYYTIGQRQGLGIGGVATHQEAPWFVADKVPERQALIVVQGHDHPRLYAPACIGVQMHWIAGQAPVTMQSSLHCRLRHRQPLQACTISARANDEWLIRFATPQRAVTPGQAAVLYSGRQCLGGCIIQQAYHDQ